ncbi:MAG TPA: hypothetical protein VEH06_02305 [Candidatus Bathyarchaeia archaeon]|nr:hypothetical protein [Candidatus Bathyarchaeia archaeon]
MVISILKEWDVYRGQTDDEKEVTLVNHRSASEFQHVDGYHPHI